MKVSRRKFLKISAGAIGTAVAADISGLGLNMSAAQEQAMKVPIKTGKQTPSLCPYCSGGATISNEWNYAQQKLLHGLGVVYVENQARI